LKNNGSSGEDLWAYLIRICSLQADVARLHLTLEGIGLGDSVTPHSRNDGDENSDRDGGGFGAEKWRAREFERSVSIR
jgi:hypothetical protein